MRGREAIEDDAETTKRARQDAVAEETSPSQAVAASGAKASETDAAEEEASAAAAPSQPADASDATATESTADTAGSSAPVPPVPPVASLGGPGAAASSSSGHPPAPGAPVHGPPPSQPTYVNPPPQQWAPQQHPAYGGWAGGGGQQVCKDFTNGVCHRGAACKFAHVGNVFGICVEKRIGIGKGQQGTLLQRKIRLPR